MAKLIVHYESGEPDRVIEFDPRKAPFQHDGRPLENGQNRLNRLLHD